MGKQYYPKKVAVRIKCNNLYKNLAQCLAYSKCSINVSPFILYPLTPVLHKRPSTISTGHVRLMRCFRVGRESVREEELEGGRGPASHKDLPFPAEPLLLSCHLPPVSLPLGIPRLSP